MRLKYFIIICMALVLTSASNAFALLKIDITQGNVEPVPIAISPFLDASGGESDLGERISEVVESDLRNSGLFRILDQSSFLERLPVDKIPTFVSWRQVGANAVGAGRVITEGGKVTVEFRLWDPFMESQIEGSVFTLSEKSWRRVAHKIADQIYMRLTGEAGYFDTRVLFIAESGNLKHRKKKLAIMDQDGANYRELTNGKYMVLTPRFDTRIQRAIYMSYKNRVPQVFTLDIQSGRETLVGDFPGMSFAPRFSPDGRKAVMSIAKNGTTDIYEINLSTKALKRLTDTQGRINTSPSYSPDGKRIVFNSDRGGRPALYVMNSNGSGVKKVSMHTGTYSTPVWSPRGDFIAFTKQEHGTFYIGVMRPDGSGERLLTSSWMDEGPTWSPNGRVIMFSRQRKGAGYNLYAIDVTGYNERKISTPADSSDPAWSPLMG